MWFSLYPCAHCACPKCQQHPDVGMVGEQCQAINVGFELYIGIESKLSISIIGFDLELGEFCHDFHSISIPINHSGTHFNLPAISTSLK